MKRLWLPILIGAFLPLSASAMEQTVVNFRDGQLQGSWAISGVDLPQSTADGLQVTTTADWSIVGTTELPHPTEVVSFTFTSPRPMEARLLWHQRGYPDGTYVQLPFVIPAGQSITTGVNVDAYAQWDRYADKVGFAVPAGASVILHDIRFTHWSPVEKTAEAWKAFWRFDKMGPYSINFLWGPVLTFNDIGTKELFTTMPPRGRSANWVFYAVIVLAGAGLALHWMRSGKPAAGKYVSAFLLCFAGLWVVYDVRMGLEFLSYAKNDYQTFLSMPVGSRTYRTYANFPDIVSLAEPFLKPKEQFVFLGPPNTPFIAEMRYFAYPAMPVDPQGPSDLHTWVVFDRADIALTSDGRLAAGETVLSKPGAIVKRLDEFSFIFQTDESVAPNPNPTPNP